MTDILPAPLFSIELNSCSCKKTKCTKGKCSCYQNHLKCTDLCNCNDCENIDTRFSTVDNENDKEDEDNDNN